MKHLLAAPALVLSAALAPIVLLAGAASAHVTVNPSTAVGGSWSKLTFRVPTESDTASTTKVQIFFPTDVPFQSVTVKPHPGWSYKIAKQGDAVEQITWTPQSPADAIKPGEFDEFDISAGPLPESGSVTFKALQTYSNGEIVRWIGESTKADPEPDHPAPVLTLTAGDTSAAAAVADNDEATAHDEDDDKAPIIVASLALLVSIGAFGLAALRRKQSR